MAVYEGGAAAREHLVEVAKACAVAAARAPTLTPDLGLRQEIVTDADLLPMIDIMETMGQASDVLFMDALTYRKLYDAGTPPPVLLIGADLTRPVGWDCGGCGFPDCGEFAAYVRGHRGQGTMVSGPSCLWRVVDLGIAADFACACAAMHRAEARIQFTMGAISAMLGHLAGCSCALGLPVGPVGKDHWFDRKEMAGVRDYEALSQGLAETGPNLRMAFAGTGSPMVKTGQRWWENPTFHKVRAEADAPGKQEALREAIGRKLAHYAALRAAREPGQTEPEA
ncbi:MAG: hypothetical protein HY900_35845 [Deltaproteobacteria bacterium]|nr:hypothetical protein [Deltaproteobacteria bacterium]